MYINEEAAAAVVKSVAGNQYFIVPPGILSRRRRRFLGGQNSSAREKFCRSRSQALLDNGWDDEDEHEDGVEVFTVSSRQCSRTARICLRTWPSTFRFLRYLVEPYRHADRKMPTVRVFRLPFKANIVDGLTFARVAAPSGNGISNNSLPGHRCPWKLSWRRIFVFNYYFVCLVSQGTRTMERYRGKIDIKCKRRLDGSEIAIYESSKENAGILLNEVEATAMKQRVTRVLTNEEEIYLKSGRGCKSYAR